MRFQPDLLLEMHRGRWLKSLDRLFLLLAEAFIDGVAHAVGFAGGLGFGLDPEPGLTARRIADVFHVSSKHSIRRAGPRTVRAGAALSAEDNVPRQG